MYFSVFSLTGLWVSGIITRLSKRKNTKKHLPAYTDKCLIFLMSGYQDSNLGPPAPKAGALTGLRYTPKYGEWM